eukprot:360487-Chlamydomonas_euryale.AAC.2
MGWAEEGLRQWQWRCGVAGSGSGGGGGRDGGRDSPRALQGQAVFFTRGGGATLGRLCSEDVCPRQHHIISTQQHQPTPHNHPTHRTTIPHTAQPPHPAQLPHTAWSQWHLAYGTVNEWQAVGVFKHPVRA